MITFRRRTFQGCEYLGPLGDHGIYVTDAELTPDVLRITIRLLDADGRVVPDPEIGPNWVGPPLFGTELSVFQDGAELDRITSGFLGSLGEGLMWFLHEAPTVEGPVKLDITSNKDPDITVHVELV